jgi:hypothetical protein
MRKLFAGMITFIIVFSGGMFFYPPPQDSVNWDNYWELGQYHSDDTYYGPSPDTDAWDNCWELGQYPSYEYNAGHYGT